MSDNSPRNSYEFTHPTESSTRERELHSDIVSGSLLALLPIASFLMQYAYSSSEGTQQIFFHHTTVALVDWVFVPFNFFVVRVIDWHRGLKLYSIFCISVVLNVFVHSYWQSNGTDLGHMISKAGIILHAGWVHIGFSTIEMVLVVAFVFCRRDGNSLRIIIPTILLLCYFIAVGASGFYLHNGFIASDVVLTVSGLFFVLIYPLLREVHQR